MNKEYYHMEDFTEDNYKIILKQLLYAEYEFIEFEYEKILSDAHIILWRHDVDVSLNRAYKLAEIEAELGIKATYFIHLQSNFYNIFEPVQYEIVKKIVDKGHLIGLHFDIGFYIENKRLINKEDIEKYAVIEKKILEQFFNIEIKVISFHNPEIGNALELQEDYYADMVNVYSRTIRNSCKYCSDSNGYWRYERLQDIIVKGYKKLHILTHPVWWEPFKMLPYERIKRCVDGRRDAVIDIYCNMMKQYGRKNLGYTDIS